MLEVISQGVITVKDISSVIETDKKVEVVTYPGYKGEVTVSRRFSDIQIRFPVRSMRTLEKTNSAVDESKHTLSRISTSSEDAINSGVLADLIEGKFGSIYHMRAISSDIAPEVINCSAITPSFIREAEAIVEALFQNMGAKVIVEELHTMDILYVYGVILESHSLYSYLPRDYSAICSKRNSATVDSSCIIGLGRWYDEYLNLPTYMEELHAKVSEPVSESVQQEQSEQEPAVSEELDEDFVQGRDPVLDIDWSETPVNQIRISGNAIPRGFKAEHYKSDALSDALYVWHIVRSTFDKTRAALNSAVAPLATAFDGIAEVPDAKSLVCQIIQTTDLLPDMSRLGNFVGRQVAFDQDSRFSSTQSGTRKLSDDLILVPMRTSFIAAVAAQDQKVALHTKGIGGLIVSFYAALDLLVTNSMKYQAAESGGTLTFEKEQASDWLFASIQTYLKAHGNQLEKNAACYSISELFHKIVEAESGKEDYDEFGEFGGSKKKIQINVLRAAVSHVIPAPIDEVMSMTINEMHSAIIEHVDSKR